MAITSLTDMIVPEVFSAYLMDNLTVKNLLFTSGIVEVSPLLASKLEMGGDDFNFPYFDDITQGESNVPVEGTAQTAGKIGTYKITVPRQMRTKDWGATKIAEILSGSKPLSAIQERALTYWKTDLQNNLNAIIKGIVGTTGGADITTDKAAEDGDDPAATNIISPEHIIDAQGALGDNQSGFKGIILHSKVANDLRKQGLIETVPYQDQAGTFERYQNLVVFVDDNVPTYTRTSATLGNQTVFATLMVKGGAFMYGESTNGFDPVYVDYDRSKGMGEEVLYTKKMFALHPKGFNWKGTPAGLAPTNTELATSANWEMKYDYKLSNFVVLLTN